jgi:hypothetical protein
MLEDEAMSARRGLLVFGVCGLLIVALAGGAAGDATVLAVSKGEMPADTNADPQMALEEKQELGGSALKVVFTDKDSTIGETHLKLANWSGFKAIKFDAFNPSQNVVSLSLCIRHKGTTGYPTRCDTAIMLKPGKSSLEFPLADMANVDGSRPDFSFVKHWYIACGAPGTTVYFGDLSLAGEGAAAPTPAAAPSVAPAAPAVAAAPAQAIRITGKIGDTPVDLTITGVTITMAAGGGAAVPAPTPGATAPAAPAPAPAPGAGAKATLLGISKGAMPNDTNEDPKLALDDKAELGGVCLKVTFAKGSSFGMSRAGLKDWRGYANLKFAALNPANAPVTVELTIKHEGTKNFGTRVDKQIVLAPGKNDISVPIAGIANNDGSAADLSSVRHWYIACNSEATVFFGDFVLEGGK